MADPVFQAPPPVNPPEAAEPSEQQVTPPVPEEVSPVQMDAPKETTENQEAPSQKQQAMNRINGLKEHMIRYFWYSMAGLFLLGAFFGCAMSGSDSTPKQAPVVTGISKRVVSNGDKKVPLKICGADSASKSCLFYVQNNKTYDVQAEDFFEEIAQKTQRNPFNIGLDNPLYRRQIIKPGYFAEIIVPAT